MEVLLLVLAAAALGSGAVLWRVDRGRKTTADTEPEAPVSESVEEPAEELIPAPEPEEPSAEPDRSADFYSDDAEPLDEDVEVALAEVPEVDVEELPAVDDDSDAPEPETTHDTPVKPQRRHGGGLHLGQRRERRSWAHRRGFDFAREDGFLTDEWSRGAASSGAKARDVVSGMASGYEMHLVDLADSTVMAMRRGTMSDVVVDARRIGTNTHDDGSTDLVDVEVVEDFQILSTNAGAARRMIDERVIAAFSALPEDVVAVWMESDWVLAETPRGSHSEVWEGMVEPLALLADASFTLPPRRGALRKLDLGPIAPTRPMVDPPAPERSTDAVVEEDLKQPLVVRPEEPLELPSRAQSQSRGVVEPHSIGGDDIDAIADGRDDKDPSVFRGTRVLRDQTKGPSIFDDGAP